MSHLVAGSTTPRQPAGAARPRATALLLFANAVTGLLTAHGAGQTSSITTSFQNGVAPTAAYAGNDDTYLDAGSPGSSFGASTTVKADGSPDQGALIRWEVSAIPRGSLVQSASLTVHVTDSSGASALYEVYAAKRPWSESSATWSSASAGTSWQSPGAQGAADRSTTVLAALSGSTGSRTFPLNAAGVAVVQSWVDNPAANFGLVIQDYVSSSDGFQFRSSEHGTRSSRPRLSVTYAPGPGPTPTPTPTPPGGTPGIVDGPTLRLAGTHTFSFNPSAAGGTVSWRVDRETVSESGGTPSRTNGVATATGSTATFNLTKVSGSETVYYVNASDSGASDVHTVQVFPANVRSSFLFKSTGNPNVLTYVIVPASLSPATHVVMVNHGTGRNADEYCNSWVTWSAQNNYVTICPRFDDSGWPGSRGYNLGNVFTGDDGAGTKNPESKWSFTVAENIAKKTLAEFGLNDKLFDMWGHSAGGQFVHRFMIFKPQAPVRFSMPANSGWYTAPDLNIDFPYGLKHPLVSFTSGQLSAYTREHMIVMRGEKDVLRDSSLRTTPEADAQGRNRFERAGYMYQKGVEANPNLNWRLINVPNADHDQAKMAPGAQQFLNNPHKALPFRCPLPDNDPCHQP